MRNIILLLLSLFFSSSLFSDDDVGIDPFITKRYIVLYQEQKKEKNK
jgi:hypothetical protein|tara:strand:- start:389 stop:529 length:141 start_codon:yes stop_codon:yes gene_type:complete